MDPIRHSDAIRIVFDLEMPAIFWERRLRGLHHVPRDFTQYGRSLRWPAATYGIFARGYITFASAVSSWQINPKLA